MADWLPQAVTLIAVIVGAGIPLLARWMESRQQYQVMTFEKRLSTHQAAYDCICKLLIAVHSDEPDKIREAVQKFDDWWDSNCLFLDEKSRTSMFFAVEHARFYADAIHGYDESRVRKYREGAIKQLSISLTDIERGIGVKYLPQIKKKPKKRRVWKCPSLPASPQVA